jgi:hypothetical protein
MISKDLERALSEESIEDLRVFADRLQTKRTPLENALVERTRLEVEEARFQNRVAMAKTILNKLRKSAHATLADIGGKRGRGTDWPSRLLEGKNSHLDAIDRDGISAAGSHLRALNGEITTRPEAAPELPNS